MKDRLRRLSYRLRHDFLSIENVVLLLAIILCLTWTYQSVVSMSRNWTLVEELGTKKKELELLTIEVETAELENEYLKSNEYQELQARKLLDKQLPGEQMVVMPKNSEAAINKYKTVTTEKVEKERSNIEKWLMYLFPSR